MPKPKRTVSFPWRGRRRWSVAEARAVLAAHEHSGLGPSEFAAREGFDVQRLYRWRRHLSTVGVRAVSLFAEISATALAASHDRRFEVELASGRTIRVPAGFDDAELRRLVAILEAPC